MGTFYVSRWTDFNVAAWTFFNVCLLWIFFFWKLFWQMIFIWCKHILTCSLWHYWQVILLDLFSLVSCNCNSNCSQIVCAKDDIPVCHLHGSECVCKREYSVVFIWTCCLISCMYLPNILLFSFQIKHIKWIYLFSSIQNYC